MSFTPQQANEVVTQLVEAARREPNGRIDLRDPTGAVVATVQAHALPKRPKDMPRHLRPKMKLSKRERDAAKRMKREPAAIA